MSRSVLDYTFAVGKIRALERFLIPAEVFTQAIEAELAEALRLFTDSGLYPDDLLRAEDSQQLENILAREELKLKKIIRELILDQPLLGLIDLGGSECMVSALQTYRSRFLEDYFKHLIDMHNIKTFLRLYLLKEPQDKLDQLIGCAGFIQKEELLKLYSQGLAAFIHRLGYVHKHSQTIDYAFFLKEPIEKMEKERSFIALEKAINDFLIESLRPAKYIVFGPEPILAYYLAKRNEINLIRMIILAKLNHAPSEILKERPALVHA